MPLFSCRTGSEEEEEHAHIRLEEHLSRRCVSSCCMAGRMHSLNAGCPFLLQRQKEGDAKKEGVRGRTPSLTSVLSPVGQTIRRERDEEKEGNAKGMREEEEENASPEEKRKMIFRRRMEKREKCSLALLPSTVVFVVVFVLDPRNSSTKSGRGLSHIPLSDSRRLPPTPPSSPSPRHRRCRRRRFGCNVGQCSMCPARFSGWRETINQETGSLSGFPLLSA